MELQSINIFKDLDVKNTSYSKYTRLDIVRHYPAHVMEILPGWWDPKIKKVASRITSFDTQHFITIFFAISEPPKGLHGLHCSWVFSILVIPFCRGKPERRPENKTHALKSLEQPPLPQTNWTTTYFSSALRTGGNPPQLCLYTVSRIWQPWICGKHSLFNLDSISVIHVAQTHILYSI